MIIPEWLSNQDNAFLIVAILLLLWLWLLINRRQEEEKRLLDLHHGKLRRDFTHPYTFNHSFFHLLNDRQIQFIIVTYG